MSALAHPLKYRSLALLLDLLAVPLAAGRVALAERWRDDEQSLGLYRPGEPQLAAYVFTYGQAPGRYAVELGFPALEGRTAAGVPLVQEGLCLARILEALQAHFDLPERPGD